MIELYTWPTPNGHKVHIMLEETGLAYNVHPVNIGAGDQFDPAYLKLNPNNKMPTIVDTEGPNGKPYTVFESGAILMYLAEKTGKFMPKDMAGRYDRHPMGHVPDGRHRPDVRPGAPLPQLRAGQDPIRHRPLHQRVRAGSTAWSSGA